MKIESTEIPGLVTIEPRVFEDDRGFFVETFQKARFQEAGLECRFVQDNHTRSRGGTLRGLHYQLRRPQGKLVGVVRGEIFDVAVDLRRSSPTFGRWAGVRLSEVSHRRVYIPPGLAHGFCVVSEVADVVYNCTDYYDPEDEHTILWRDPQLAIDWPIREPIVSEKDKHGLPFAQAPCFDSEPVEQDPASGRATVPSESIGK